MFIHPLLLWALPLVLVPLVIHLINLLRHRRIRWGAMEFLLAGFRRHRTWVRMKEMLLLLMRMLAVAMIVLAVAQPVLKNRLGGVLPGGSRTHHIVLVDDSYSMTDRLDGENAFDAAKTVILRLGEEAARHPAGLQNFTLLRYSQARAETVSEKQDDSAETATLAKLVPDMHTETVDGNFKQRLENILAPLSAGDFADDPLPALSAVDQLAPRAADEKRIVYLVTDFRKHQWAENVDLKKALTDLEKAGVTLKLIDCVDAEHPNLAVTNLSAGDGTRAAGVPLVMHVEVTNYGTSAAKNVTVHPETDAEGAGTLPAITISEIPPGETVREQFIVKFPAAAAHSIRVRLDSDAIPADNQRACVLDFPPYESVLVIDSDADAADGKTLMMTLAPGGNVNTGIVPRLELPRFLSTNPLATYSAIYLLNVGNLDAQAITSLEEYIQAGGGVAVFVGPRTDPTAALSWHRDGEGFFPVKLRQAADLTVDYLQKIPDLRVSNHPVFRIFAGGRDAGLLGTVNVTKYYRLEDESLERLIPQDDQRARPAGETDLSPDTQIIASLRNNDPLVLQRRYGEGRVAVFLTTASPAWNNWARGNPSYVVTMLQLQAWLSAKTPPRDFTVGDTLTLSLDPEAYLPDLQFISPVGENLGTVKAVPQADGTFFASGPRAETAGIYHAKLSPRGNQPDTLPLAVNVDPREGNTRRLAGEELAQTLKGIPYEYHRAAEFYLSEDTGVGVNISDMLLYLLIVWLILEMLLAANASYHIAPAATKK